ncbi:IS982 family transposase [Streptomyces misionensis]|uniref:IS982 family transposase n=1 Tax=Streptomyces misionensis TaxID=67331 RepID=A0A5C6JZD3_9ACTN|nr:IS982 family transposase [Streptomyces misionensis]TWV49627.1 IS982 family transposase [Streptomyces misionensis]TWV55539.1 IS982 family transposase [Streptomyces misionensis]
MTTELDTLLTALYVHIDDRLKTPRRRGRPPRLTDAELVTLAVAQAMLGFHCEARWLRFAHAHLHAMFPYLPQRPAYNKRLRAALGLVKQVIRSLAADTDLWLDPVWIVDSTPVECARSRETVKRSDLAGWAGYGYCRSHSRFYWGLKLHLVCTPAGLPVTWALADPKIDERQVLAALIDNEPHLATDRAGLLILADKGYIAAELDRFLAARGISLLRPSYRNRGTPRPGEGLLKTVRQLIESVNDTLKGQLDLEQHGGRTIEGVGVRVAQRILAMTCAIWHNRTIGAPITRSLTAYDH